MEEDEGEECVCALAARASLGGLLFSSAVVRRPVGASSGAVVSRLSPGASSSLLPPCASLSCLPPPPVWVRPGPRVSSLLCSLAAAASPPGVLTRPVASAGLAWRWPRSGGAPPSDLVLVLASMHVCREREEEQTKNRRPRTGPTRPREGPNRISIWPTPLNTLTTSV